VQTVALVLVLLTSPSQRAASDAEVLALGRRLSADFWAGRLDPVWAQMNDRMQGLLGSPVGLSTARDQLLEGFGGPGKTLGERVVEVQGVRVYLRTFQGTTTERPLLEQWSIEDGTKVAGFFVRHTQLTVETQPETAPARYLLAACLLGGTALSMGAVGFWLRRSKKAP
jgi:hypothetical protein